MTIQTEKKRNMMCANQFFALKRVWRRSEVRQQDFSRILSAGYMKISLGVILVLGLGLEVSARDRDSIKIRVPVIHR